jgi:NAD(P)H-dependent flavin oxidoreductase YrpB (nitropropane dioxygenase family)
VQVYSVSGPRGQATRDIESYYQAINSPVEGRSGENLAWMIARESGLAVRYLLQPGTSDRQTLVTRIAMSEAAFDASLKADATASRLESIPSPANAIHLHHQKANAEGFEIEISRAEMPVESVSAGLDRAMESDGWQKTLPKRSGLCLYQRGRSLALINVQADPDGGSLITRGYKSE